MKFQNLIIVPCLVYSIAGAFVLHDNAPEHLASSRNLGMNQLFTKINETCEDPELANGTLCIDELSSVSILQGLTLEHIATVIFVQVVLTVTEAPDRYW